MRITMFLFHTFQNDHRILKEARSLITAGHEVTLIALRTDDSLPAERNEEGIRVIRLRMRRWPFRKGRYLEYFLRAGWNGWRSKADVYHCHDLDTLVPALLASRWRRSPLIYDSHELFTETHSLVGREREKRIWSWIERTFIPHATRTITVSDPIAEEMSRRYGMARPRVIRNCPAYHPPPTPRPLLEAAGDEPLFLCQGYLQKGRGLEMLVGAMLHVERGRLVLLGDGEMREELQALIQNLKLQEKVHLLPAVPIEELPSYTASATLGLIAYSTVSLNFLYALPNKFFEYVMAGVPVLSTPIPEVARLIEEHELGWVLADPSPQSLADEMNRIARCGDEIARRKENCLRAARKLHWGEEEKKLLALYREVEGIRRGSK